jgi:hypothetical protein
MVPALGYLEQYERLMKKARQGKLTELEMLILVQKFDPGELYDYEQSRELSIALLKEWLVKYKFKDWKKTQRRKLRVTPAMRKKRAEEIARKLNQTGHWHSHGRGISMEVLRRELNLQIEDFGQNDRLNGVLRNYYKFLIDYTHKIGHAGALHTNGRYMPFSGG